jgi:hypothetical protein
MSDMTAAISSGASAPQRPLGYPVHDTTSGTVITAEIPAVRAGPSYGVLLPDGSVWYPGSRKRLPAPFIVRVVVWILAFAVFLGAAGDFVIRYHPSWVGSLRHIVPAQSAAASSGATRTGTSTASTKGSTPSEPFALMAPQPTGLQWSPLTAYTLKNSDYSVTVTAGDQPVWVQAQAYANKQVSGTAQFVTLGAGKYVLVTLPEAKLIEIAAQGATIKMYQGFTQVGIVPTPPHCPCFILLEPVHH